VKPGGIEAPENIPSHPWGKNMISVGVRFIEPEIECSCTAKLRVIIAKPCFATPGEISNGVKGYTTYGEGSN
jgi:hypothetical protein